MSALAGQRLEYVDPRDHAHQPPVLGHRQPVVPPAGDDPPGLVDAGVGRDRDRVLGHHVRHGQRQRLAQALLEVARRLEEDDAAEQLDVVREVQVALLVGDDEVGLRDDPDAAPALVDDRHARQFVPAQELHDGLGVVLRLHRDRIGVHDVGDGEGHGGRDLTVHHACGSASITSRAMTPSTPRSPAARTPARACRRTPAHAAANGSTPRASIAAITPLSTSPVPAVASAALAPGLTATVPPGSATSVSSPLSTTIAWAVRAASRTWCSRRAFTSSLSMPSSRPSSPSCGVSTVGALRSASAPSSPAWAFSPSASSSTATPASRTSRRTNAAAPSVRPIPGPATSAPPRRESSSTCSTPASVCAPASPGRPRVIPSSRRISKIVSGDAGTRAVT